MVGCRAIERRNFTWNHGLRQPDAGAKSCAQGLLPALRRKSDDSYIHVFVH
jgi:hypothetical protein